MGNNVEMPSWLERLPLAPEYRPTDTEFADPIAYISRIEKEASAFGICKIIPPLSKPSKKYVFSNLNKSLSKCPDLGSGVDLSRMGSNDGEARGFFTTRHQELGHSVKRTKGMVDNDNLQLGVHKQVWQSGEVYTLEQFESKSKVFARGLLSLIKDVSPLVIEALFWKAASEKPIYVEYANDVPGSGFGEPEGQFQYFHKRRRKMKSWKSYRSRGRDDGKNNEIDTVRSSHNDDGTDASVKDDSKTCLETSNSSTTSSSMPLDDNSQSLRRKSVHGSADVEGTAGWKLSNSPWNLQVIARSPGSLTRFMPDDIPGVTSPMVYIGMLFSWFAWHVEDHELHSMNFLHTGAAKTWYAVPGDYAFAFEEVIRSEAYGGSIDRLAALALLGEKTTLVTPELIVASGIPCCRLVQNPGEFVVTFPRAYHAGFSHGFNCGEAANFGTPQWLKVAKEAAVRRAAMNYLPMLSHQQLLYLLTMSFVSRVPRSLLPGARSSRLRDRQKEERELLVKKAFIEDILVENSTLSILLGQESSIYAVLWHPDLLPCPSKDIFLTTGTDAVRTEPGESVSHIQPEKNNNQNNLLDEMSLYMETLNDLYLDDHDMSCDFQIDSGTLACVACGILGFPFMAVVQLSEQASIELLLANHELVHEGPGSFESKVVHPVICLDGTVSSSVSEDLSPVPETSVPPEDVPVPSVTKFTKRWNTSSKFLRPRIFCLEHALQIKELLRSKGGANILVICHSDFQKIKAHAAVIAEEIGTRFNYTDVQVDSASQEDLHLIDLAIDDGENDECNEDWTTKLEINLKHCIKVRKNSPSKRVQHALSLGGLFSETSTSSDFSKVRWQSRRCRSKTKSNPRAQSKLCQNIEIKTDEVLGHKSNDIVVKRKEQIIQYSRRKCKLKPDLTTAESSGDGHSRKLLPEEASAATWDNLSNHYRINSNISSCNIEDNGSIVSGLALPPIGMSERLHEIQVLEASSVSLNYSPSRVVDSLATASVVVDSIEQIEIETLKELKEEGENCCMATCNSAEMRADIKDASNAIEKIDISYGEKCSSQSIASGDIFDIQIDQVKDNDIMNGTCDLASKGQNDVATEREVSMNEVCDAVNSLTFYVASPSVEHFDVLIGDTVVDNSSMNGKVCDLMNDNEVQQDMQVTNEKSDDEPLSCYNKLINQLNPASKEESCEDLNDACPGNRMPLQNHVLQESYFAEVMNEEHVMSSVRLMNQSDSVSLESSEIPGKECAAADLCTVETLENEELGLGNCTIKGRKEEIFSSSVTCMELDRSSPCLVEGFSDITRGNCAKEDLCIDVIDPEVQPKFHNVTRSSMDELVSGLQIEGNAVSVGACSELPNGISAEEKLGCDVTRDIDLLEDAQTSNATIEKPNPSSLAATSQPIPAVIKTYSRTRKESCSKGKLFHGNEHCSEGNRKQESNKSAVEDAISNARKGRKRNREVEQLKTEDQVDYSGFIRSPCEGLRPRAATKTEVDISKMPEDKPVTKTARSESNVLVPCQDKKKTTKEFYKCDLDGCRMRFETKRELSLHKSNRCPHEGCGKRFSSHKYAIIHQRVHDDDRPLKCPWEGCLMSFKWAWARTEHIRVHTGERPYQCKVEGCGLSFRFVSDISRHRRKTGHYENVSS